MSCCSLGVNAFRPGFQVAAHQFSKPCARLRLFNTAPSSRFFSLWRPLSPQPPRRQTTAKSGGLLANAHRQSSPQPFTFRTFRVSGFRVINHYVDLPPSYEDEVGLPFRNGGLGADEVVALFGARMSTKSANKLLMILHGRRVAGTLEDPTLQVNTAEFSPKDHKIALEWLRKNISVDEIVNAGLRAEDELAALEMEQDDQVYEVPEPVAVTEEPATKKDVYGVGVFDAIRAKNKVKYEAELKRREEEAELKRQEEEANSGQTLELQALGQRLVGEKFVRPPSEKMVAYMEAAQSELHEPPEMSVKDRLLPSVLVGLLVIGLFVAYAAFYDPPRRSERLFPDIPPAAATVGALILMNLAICTLWRIPPAWPLLNRYFIIQPATPRAFHLFGAMFSHIQAWHLGVNMLTLWFVGTAYHDDVGRGDFLATYVTAGTVGFLASLIKLVLTKQLDVTTLGASGAIYGLLGGYFWLHRFEGFKVLGLPPDPFNGAPGMGFIGLIVGLNIAAMVRGRNASRWDIPSHFGGLGVGILAAHLIEKRREAKRRFPTEVMNRKKEQKTAERVRKA